MQVNVYTEQEVTVIKQFTIEVSAPEVVAYFDLSPNEDWQEHIKEYVDSRLTEMSQGVDQHYVRTIGSNEAVHEVIYERS